MKALRMICQALLLAAAAAVIVFALTGIGSARLDTAQAEYEVLAARAATLRARFDESTQTPTDAAFPAALRHTGETAAAATLDLQQSIVDLGTAHQLTLLTFGAGRIPYQLSTPALAVELEAQGEWSDTIRFLAALEAMAPRVAVANLSLRAMPGAAQSGQRAPVALRLVIWGFYPDGGV